jgi:putative membrane protein
VTAADPGAPRRLSRRMLLIHPVQELPRALPALLGAFVAGSGSGQGALWSAGALAITLGFALSRWFTTRYRVTDDRVEVRTGLLRRRVLAVSRDRVRTVDVTARAMHRLLGLTRVDVGTGRSDRERGSAVRLDGLTEAEAAALREELLHRREQAPELATEPTTATPVTELAQLDPRWVRYAPFTLSGVVTVGVVVGFLANLASEAHLDPERSGPVRQVAHRLDSAPVAVAVAVLAVLALLAVVVASTVGYALAFWNFRLTRHPGGTLHVTRGLITTRSTTIEERRLHGAEISEPLLLRLASGARLVAIATGLRVGDGAERGGSLLVPPAPRAEVQRVAAAVIGRSAPLTCPIAEHGPRARSRRYTRALGGWALPAAALAVVHWIAGGPAWPLVVALVLLPIVVLLAADRYRNLGHAVADSSLVARSGSLVRRRCVLSAEGIIGWNVERSFFQRRVGLATLTATTAAGRQHYDVQDVDLGEALRVAEELVPGLAAPFLDRRPASVRQPPATTAAPPQAGPRAQRTRG